MELYGQIDVDAFARIVKEHPECIKVVQKRDGTAHRYLNINISERREPDQYGRTHYIKAGVPKANQKQGVNYYIADLKPSANQAAPQPQQQYNTPAPSPAPEPQSSSDPLPF